MSEMKVNHIINSSIIIRDLHHDVFSVVSRKPFLYVYSVIISSVTHLFCTRNVVVFLYVELAYWAC